MNRTFRFYYIMLILFSLALFAGDESVSQAGKEKWFSCVVEKVLDGDSIVCKNGITLRYAGIDSPEYGMPWSNRARKRNKELVAFKKVNCLMRTKDRYGRYICVVFAEGQRRSVNEILIREGYAWVYYHKNTEDLWKKWLPLQRKAMKLERKVWGFWASKQGRVIGNKRSKRFHTLTCSNGAKISKRNRIPFYTYFDAFYAGYAPARGCIIQNLTR